MNGGSTVLLGEVVRVKHGYAFPGSGFSDDPSYPSVLTPGNFAIGGGFQSGKVKTFSGSVNSEYVLAPGDLVVSMTDLSKEGDTLGSAAMIPRGPTYLHNQRIGLMQNQRPDLVLLEWLHYRLRLADYHDRILGTASGSTVRHTSPSRIEAFPIELPPIGAQLSIAQVLGALDDKIAANAKVAFASGELAQHIFQSAAGHAVTRQTYDDVADVAGGGTPSTREPAYWGGDVLWATPTDVTGLSSPYLDQTSRMITQEGLEHCASALHPAGSILMTSRATIGAFALAKRPVAVNQGFIVVQAKDSSHQWWLFHEMQTRVTDYLAHANGATFLELSRGRFKTLQLDWPCDDAVMRKFADRVEPLHDRAYQAMLENRELVTLRDTLLPNLMSGRIAL